MKKILKLVQTTLIGGLFFLVPLVLLSIIVVRAFAVIKKLTEPLLKPFSKVGQVGEGVQDVIGVILLLLICLLAGLFSRTKTARRMIASLERGVLQYIPGYMLLKNMAENTAGIDSHDELKVVLIRTDAGWQLGFIVDKVNDSLYVVFAPDAPNTMSGSVVLVEIEHMRFIDITQKEARQCIRKLGLGSGKLFRDKLPVL